MDLDNSRPSTGYSAEGSDLADSPTEEKSSAETQFPLSHFFVVDSFNIHRLVIAGVTCASKFFSDVFYTNSRYAKVCHFSSFFNPPLLQLSELCGGLSFERILLIRRKKVGGLPLAELNHLELQFLLLNDFRLSVPVEELEAYGTMLVEFYAREVIAQRDHGHGVQ